MGQSAPKPIGRQERPGKVGLNGIAVGGSKDWIVISERCFAMSAIFVPDFRASKAISTAGRIVLFAVVFGAANPGTAQSSTNAAPAINLDYKSALLRVDSDFLLQPRDTGNTIAGKHFQLTGPLVGPMKSKKLWQVPGRLLQWINPFAKSGPGAEAAEYRPADSMAWSTLADWKGRSPFPDDTHHEPQLRLLSVSTGK